MKEDKYFEKWIISDAKLKSALYEKGVIESERDEYKYLYNNQCNLVRKLKKEIEYYENLKLTK